MRIFKYLHSGGTGAALFLVAAVLLAAPYGCSKDITDASTKQAKTVTVAVGKAVQLNDAGLKIRLEVIVPDYAIAENRIESRSNEPKNPAALIEIIEGDKVVARGWVFKNFPEFNSYTDARFPVVLVETGTAK